MPDVDHRDTSGDVLSVPNSVPVGERVITDTRTHYVGGPVGHEMTQDEAYQLGLMLFDAINGARTNAGSDSDRGNDPQ